MLVFPDRPPRSGKVKNSFASLAPWRFHSFNRPFASLAQDAKHAKCSTKELFHSCPGVGKKKAHAAFGGRSFSLRPWRLGGSIVLTARSAQVARNAGGPTLQEEMNWSKKLSPQSSVLKQLLSPQHLALSPVLRPQHSVLSPDSGSSVLFLHSVLDFGGWPTKCFRTNVPFLSP